MTDFHGRIMNTQGRCASMIVGSVSSYSQGYKEARHAAAEIASEADTEIARLRGNVARMRQALNDWILVEASDFCDESDVEAARARVGKHGFLAYVGEALKESDQ